MANEQNLRPCEYKLSQEEAKKGGMASVKARRRKKLMSETAKLYLQQMLENGKTRQDALIEKAFANCFNGSPSVDDLLKVQKLLGEEKTTIETEIKMPNFNITEE